MSAISSKTSKAQIVALYNDIIAERDQIHANLCKALLENDKLINENKRLREAALKSIVQTQTKAPHELLAEAIGGDNAWKIAEAFEQHLRSGLAKFEIKATCYSLSTEDEVLKKWILRVHMLLSGRAYPPQISGKKLTLNWKK